MSTAGRDEASVRAHSAALTRELGLRDPVLTQILFTSACPGSVLPRSRGRHTWCSGSSRWSR
jgi:hypothetical protein